MTRISPRLLLVLAFLVGLAAPVRAQTGLELIEESLRKQAPPANVFEEQVLVLSDAVGQHTVRTVRYYARNDAGGTQRLMVIDTPLVLRGLRVYVARDSNGTRRGPAGSSLVFGSDYTVADFEGEQPSGFTYEREPAQELDRVTHFVVRAIPKDEGVARATGYGTRRIYLRKDNLYVSRIDYLDRQGRLARRQTFKDPRPDESGAWRPGMTLTEDVREDRRTLLKVERRVHSADYVPGAVFDELRGGGQ
jgi:hypothetical protein